MQFLLFCLWWWGSMFSLSIFAAILIQCSISLAWNMVNPTSLWQMLSVKKQCAIHVFLFQDVQILRGRENVVVELHDGFFMIFQDFSHGDRSHLSRSHLLVPCGPGVNIWKPNKNWWWPQLSEQLEAEISATVVLTVATVDLVVQNAPDCGRNGLHGFVELHEAIAPQKNELRIVFWNTKNRPHLKRLRKSDACTASAASLASYQGLPANVLHWQSLLGGANKNFTRSVCVEAKKRTTKRLLLNSTLNSKEPWPHILSLDDGETTISYINICFIIQLKTIYI